MSAAIQPRPSVRKICVRRSPVHGKGVFAARMIRAGELICEYKGQRLDWEEALRRHPRNSPDPNHTFYFDRGDGTVIDGAVGGNSSRWINHSCNPNCEAEDNNGRIFIRAVKRIALGEELGIDYALIVEGRHTHQLREQYACHCGAPNCRRTMLADRRKRPAAKPTAAIAADSPVGEQAGTQAAIRIFERPSWDALIVSWREAGRCCYSEQLWELMDASAAGTCALSGKSFTAGEPVFRPIGSPAPTNHNARIAESSVSDLSGPFDLETT